MGFEQAAPCRHRGAPSEHLVGQVVDLLQNIVVKVVNSGGL